ncbi:MAG: bifunctional DNA-formamidopyrimidine glycosylase/DNA-(apurinic or apyrimidinic site) lyase [Zavarzinella sp.]
MPELPEVETVVRDLRPLLIGQTITELQYSKDKLRKPWQHQWAKKIVRQQILAIERRAKWLVIRLAQPSGLVVHLGMTGQLQLFSADSPPADHTHFRFVLAPCAEELRYRDIRRFGSIQWYADIPKWYAEINQTYGPEPWDISPDDWYKRVHQLKRNWKAILLDQSIISGLGNIYADETCFRAKINPSSLPVNSDKSTIIKILESARDILTEAIELRGSTIRNYIGGSGLKGNFQDEFAVYGRTELPCPNCGSPIQQVRLAGRSTHFCPQCQQV